MFVFSFQLPSQIVEPIFNAIVGATGNSATHFGPVTSTDVVEIKNGGIFYGTPICYFEAWIEVVHVAFPTLLAGSVL